MRADRLGPMLLPWLLLCVPAVLAGGWAGEFTVAFRALPARERRAIQREILDVFGLSRRPRPRDHVVGRRSAPHYLLDLYSRGAELGEGADVAISFLNRAPHHIPAPRLRHDADRRLWFDVSEIKPGDAVLHCELRIFRNISKTTRRRHFELAVSELRPEGDQAYSQRVIFTLPLTPKDKGWLLANVTDSFMTWVAFPHSNLGLVLDVKDRETGADVTLEDAGLVGPRGPEEEQPFMAAFLATWKDGKRRSIRSARKRQSSVMDPYPQNPFGNYEYYPSSKRTCQRWTLYVSFKDLGWQDWIIAPDGYGAYYCHGECSFPLHAQMNATNHAIVQTLVHLLEPGAVPKPCCAPTQLLPITVLYFDDNSNVILKKYKNMVVKSCGCH